MGPPRRFLIKWGFKDDPRIPEDCRVDAMTRIKESGQAGVVAYAITEAGFWLSSAPFAYGLLFFTTGTSSASVETKPFRECPTVAGLQPPHGSSADLSRPAAASRIFRRALAAPPRLPSGYSVERSRRRRGCQLNIPSSARGATATDRAASSQAPGHCDRRGQGGHRRRGVRPHQFRARHRAGAHRAGAREVQAPAGPAGGLRGGRARRRGRGRLVSTLSRTGPSRV